MYNPRGGVVVTGEQYVCVCHCCIVHMCSAVQLYVFRRVRVVRVRVRVRVRVLVQL
jgi:hypothetical protein